MAEGTLLRAIYVSQSLNNVNHYWEKNTFISTLILMPKFFLSFHVFNSVNYFTSHGTHPFLLYHACIDPYSIYDLPWAQHLIIDTCLLFLYDLIIVFGNLYLYKYLSVQTERNTSLKEVDKRKERKRNFISAKNSIITTGGIITSTIYYSIFFGLKVSFLRQNVSKLCLLKDKFGRRN